MDILGDAQRVVVRVGELPRATGFPFQILSLGYIRDNWHDVEMVNTGLTFGMALRARGGVLHRMINGRAVRERCPVFGFSRPGNRWRNLSPDPWDEVYFVYPPTALGLFERLGVDPPERWDAVITPALVDMLRKLLKLVENHQGAGNIDRIDVLCFQIMMECIITAAAPEDADPMDALVKEVLSLMRLNHREVSDIKVFLRKRGVEYRTFLRRWKAVMPKPPASYAMALRMEQACHMLRGTGLSVKAIADDLNFTDPLYFSRQFRRQAGVSPRAYRAQWRSR